MVKTCKEELYSIGKYKILENKAVKINKAVVGYSEESEVANFFAR